MNNNQNKLDEIQKLRIKVSLPAIDSPETRDFIGRILKSVGLGIIKRSDLVPNISAHLLGAPMPELNPPLSADEHVERYTLSMEMSRNLVRMLEIEDISTITDASAQATPLIETMRDLSLFNQPEHNVGVQS